MNEIVASIESCLNILAEETQTVAFPSTIKKRSRQLQITCMLNNIASFIYILATNIFSYIIT